MGDQSLFSDADLVEYVTLMYGPEMGDQCAGIFEADSGNQSDFASSIRRNLTREVDSAIQSGRLKPSAWVHRV